MGTEAGRLAGLNHLGDESWDLASDTILYTEGRGATQRPVLLLKSQRGMTRPSTPALDALQSWAILASKVVGLVAGGRARSARRYGGMGVRQRRRPSEPSGPAPRCGSTTCATPTRPGSSTTVFQNMVQRVMGHESVTTTLQLYTRRTENHDRILDALGGSMVTREDEDPDDDEDGPAAAMAVLR